MKGKKFQNLNNKTLIKDKALATDNLKIFFFV